MEGQNVPFRVKLPPKPEQRVCHARRPHRKSREGCAKCKQRRVKCDETRPACQICERLGLECTYEAILPLGYGRLKKQARGDNALIAQFLDRITVVTPDSTAHSLAVRAVATQVDEVLLLRQGVFKGCLSNMDTLRHFQDTITPTIISKTGRHVMRRKMIRLALQSPFLMHSIIAVAIAHLHTALPDMDTISKNLGNMDALFSACLLMTVNSFSMDSYNPRQSFVFSPNPAESLNWLFLQSGLRHLLGRAKPWVPKNMWWELFMESRSDFFDDTRPGREGLHPELSGLCGITEFSTEENNPYFWPLRMLTPLLTLKPSAETFPRITTFIGRLGPYYYERLIAKDPPGLVLLAWWLALMLRVGLWWVDNRARSECTAICMYLEKSNDPLVLRLLEFPAHVCGYMLQYVQLDLGCLNTSPSNLSLDSFGMAHPMAALHEPEQTYNPTAPERILPEVPAATDVRTALLFDLRVRSAT
ncbi:hypothetical protein BDW62DRAFT_210101 [Aspergillus aurantiobrunneus]